MKKKHTVKVIIAFVLMYMSMNGRAMENLLNAYSSMLGVSVSELPDIGIEYSMIMKEAFLTALISLGICSLVMMAVPFIYRMVKKEKISYASGKKLCIWNSIILFVLPMVIGIPLVGGLGAVIYYFINMWLFVDN